MPEIPEMKNWARFLRRDNSPGCSASVGEVGRGVAMILDFLADNAVGLCVLADAAKTAKEEDEAEEQSRKKRGRKA